MFSELSPLGEAQLPPLLCDHAAGRLLHSDSRKIRPGDILSPARANMQTAAIIVPPPSTTGRRLCFGMTTARLRGRLNAQCPIKASKI